jgi:hypothetical protein
MLVSEYLDRRKEIRLRDLATALATELGPYGGLNLQTKSVAKAHLDHQVRRGILAPVWRRTEQEHS